MILFDATVKGELPALNEMITASKAHYGQYNKMKFAHDGMIKWQLKSKARDFKTLEEKVDVSIQWFTKNEKKDPDNVAAGIKFILDSLVELAILKNDTRKYIGGIHHYFETDKDNPRFRIVLTKSKEFSK